MSADAAFPTDEKAKKERDLLTSQFSNDKLDPEVETAILEAINKAIIPSNDTATEETAAQFNNSDCRASPPEFQAQQSSTSQDVDDRRSASQAYQIYNKLVKDSSINVSNSQPIDPVNVPAQKYDILFHSLQRRGIDEHDKAARKLGGPFFPLSIQPFPQSSSLYSSSTSTASSDNDNDDGDKDDDNNNENDKAYQTHNLRKRYTPSQLLTYLTTTRIQSHHRPNSPTHDPLLASTANLLCDPSSSTDRRGDFIWPGHLDRLKELHVKILLLRVQNLHSQGQLEDSARLEEEARRVAREVGYEPLVGRCIFWKGMIYLKRVTMAITRTQRRKGRGMWEEGEGIEELLEDAKRHFERARACKGKYAEGEWVEGALGKVEQLKERWRGMEEGGE